MRDVLAESSGERPFRAFDGVCEVRGGFLDVRRTQRSTGFANKRHGDMHHRRNTAQMAIDTIGIVAADNIFLVRGRFTGGLQRLARVLMGVMAEMRDACSLLMLAIAGRSAPDELERQQREHENDEGAAQAADDIKRVCPEVYRLVFGKGKALAQSNRRWYQPPRADW